MLLKKIKLWSKKLSKSVISKFRVYHEDADDEVLVSVPSNCGKAHFKCSIIEILSGAFERAWKRVLEEV